MEKKNRIKRIVMIILLMGLGVFLQAESCLAVTKYLSVVIGADNLVNGYGGGKALDFSGSDLPVGCVVQFIYAGADGVIGIPDYQGNPTGVGDVIIGTFAVGSDSAFDQYSNTPGQFFHKKTYIYPETDTPKVYVRVFDGTTIASSVYYKDFGPFNPAIQDNNPPTPYYYGINTFNTDIRFFTVTVVKPPTPAGFPDAGNIGYTPNDGLINGTFLSGKLVNSDSYYTLQWSRLPTSAIPNMWRLSFSDDDGANYAEKYFIDGMNTSQLWNSLSALNAVNSDSSKIRAEAVDAETPPQNRATAESAVFVIDNTPPAKPTGLSVSPDSSWTRLNQYQIDWTVPADLSGILDSRYRVRNTPPASNTDGILSASTGGYAGYNKANGTFTAQGIGAGGNGKYDVYVFLRDKALNTDFNNYETKIQSLWYDITPPSFSGAVEPAVVPMLTASGWTSEASFTFSWPPATETQSDTESGLRVLAPSRFPYHYLWNNTSNYSPFEYPAYNPSGTTYVVANTGTGTDQKTAAVTVGSGVENTFYFHVAAEDDVREPVGNLSYLKATGIKVDTKPPSIMNFIPATPPPCPIDVDMVITFDDEMDPATLVFKISPDVTNLAYSWSPDKKTLTMTHDTFAYATIYTATVEAIKDKVGWDLTGLPQTFTFTTVIPSLPPLVTDSRALADPNSGDITLKWKNPDSNYSGALVAYTTDYSLWDGIAEGSANFTALAVSGEAGQETAQTVSGLSTQEVYYFKLFSYVDQPGGRFYNDGAATGAGVKVAALPFRWMGGIGTRETVVVTVEGGAISFTFLIRKSEPGKLVINTISLPGRRLTRPAETELSVASELVRVINQAAGGSAVIAVSVWDPEAGRARGFAPIYDEAGNVTAQRGEDFAVSAGIGYQIFLNRDLEITFEGR
ncbi:hypothetical protein A3D23_06595 [candidate division WOR-1 bacterium RIFCSPHIGHO2_02_FULL_53_26]|nr:MAG: hypothetical protein A3D23_06595 [candidate division WOR-1 bacterium RIFCSPHIGHO2_02_FULL_53_26]